MDSSRVHAPPPGQPANYEAIVIGAGFSGLYMLYRLRELGLSTVVFEAGGDVGGTWYWNRYPGARCDSESVHYSYSFSPELEQEWVWTERYPTQPEILRYLNHVADRFDLRRDIRFNTRVTAAHYNAASNRWQLATEHGEELNATFCIAAVGCLSTPNIPAFPGLEQFQGAVYHTGLWPHEGVDFSGLRVGVIGTGSTGIQSIPQIARQAAHLYVFQRTPNYSLPARNAPLSPEKLARVKAEYRAIRAAARDSTSGATFELPEPPAAIGAASPAERQRLFEQAWNIGGFAITAAFTDLMTDLEANTAFADFVRAKIAATVYDPVVAEQLMPRDHPLGTKRPCVDTGYFETYNRENVTLVDVRNAPITAIGPHSLQTTAAEYELDALVFATGFDAMTGALFKIDIRGRDGLALKEKWAAGPRAYLGLMTAGFPNLFMITGPGSPSVLSNVPAAIEQHVEWIAACLANMRANNIAAIEPNESAEDDWVARVAEEANATLFPLANSWFLGANIPGKPRVFMAYVGGVGKYQRIIDDVAARGYAGFVMYPAG
jgi:cyclohexanone monooxygenase